MYAIMGLSITLWRAAAFIINDWRMQMKIDTEGLLLSLEEDVEDIGENQEISYVIGARKGLQIHVVVTTEPDEFLPPREEYLFISDI